MSLNLGAGERARLFELLRAVPAPKCKRCAVSTGCSPDNTSGREDDNLRCSRQIAAGARDLANGPSLAWGGACAEVLRAHRLL